MLAVCANASNSVARGLAAGLRVGGKPSTCLNAIAGNASRQGVEAVVFELVVQFVQQFHADDFTVGPISADLISAGLQVGCTALTSAAEPAVCGLAMEVPLVKAYSTEVVSGSMLPDR